ncbi:MAG: hypothetical protein HC942_27945 [Microcoleus sp. SU_5_6]|nr:hypothetical protein [Microcoleus sp. SU_5_6]NJL69569.1 hypothetical protein [Microcoleus sp. SM1_3_4]
MVADRTRSNVIKLVRSVDFSPCKLRTEFLTTMGFVPQPNLQFGQLSTINSKHTCANPLLPSNSQLLYYFPKRRRMRSTNISTSGNFI